MKFAPPNPDEFPLIFDTWANSYRKSPWAGTVPNHLWDQVSRATASEILSRGARVIAAVEDLPSGGRRVMGYSVSEPDAAILHWLYVKRDYRGIGLSIGRQLLEETTRDWPRDRAWRYTHRTRASTGFLGNGWVWDPVPARVKGTR